MKLKATLVAFAFAAGVLASIALAGPPPGHGHGKKQDGAAAVASDSSVASVPAAASCRPLVSMILKGSFVAAGGDGSSFSMNVDHANRHARHLVGSQATLMVDARTKFRRNGAAKLADFVAGDRLNVQVRVCKPRSGHGRGRHASPASPAADPLLLARRVVGRPGAAAAGEAGTTTGSSTETEGSSEGSTTESVTSGETVTSP